MVEHDRWTKTLAQAAQTAKTTAMHEQREWPRYAAEQTFALSASLDGRIYPCTVADVSLGGARLVFDDAVPQHLLGDAMIELSHPETKPVTCAPVWQSTREVGIQFDFSEESLGLISVCLRNMLELDQASVL